MFSNLNFFIFLTVMICNNLIYCNAKNINKNYEILVFKLDGDTEVHCIEKDSKNNNVSLRLSYTNVNSKTSLLGYYLIVIFFLVLIFIKNFIL